MKIVNTLAIALILSIGLIAKPKGGDEPSPPSSSKILEDIKKLNTLGSVLYLAAHPDDENTRLISWLANEQKVRTGYLSLTRGDGGQNLIGTEKGELIGVLRTQELLEARKIDGGMQFFTRAVDFGYSKTTEETLEKWNENDVLWDMVWVIRQFRPDVIITRFPATKYAGHGHHSASAVLAEKAFEMAGNPSVFPEQLKTFSAWKTNRLYHNTSSWWDKEIEKNYQSNPNMIRVDVGTYNPITGKWANQIAMESRSQHKSQGFGASILRGKQYEYLEYVKGKKASESLFDEIDITWNRVPNSNKIQTKTNEIIENYNAKNPSNSIPELINLYKLFEAYPLPNKWIEWKKKALNNIIIASAGLWFECNSKKEYAIRGIPLEVEFGVVNTGQIKSVSIENISIDNFDFQFLDKLEPNKWLRQTFELKIDEKTHLTHPYWLSNSYHNMFNVPEAALRGLPENPKPYEVTFKILIEDLELEHSIPINYKWRDRVSGENIQDFSVRPDMTVNLDNSVYVIPTGRKKTVTLSVQSHKAGLTGTLKLDLPKGWKSFPASHIVTLNKEGSTSVYNFEIEATESAVGGEFGVECKTSSNKIYNRSLVVIDYPHIHKQTLFPVAKGRLVTGALEMTSKNIGYIMGAGDNTPEAITQLGGNVTLIDPSTLAASNLSGFDAIVIGIRAYNTQESLANFQQVLIDYVNNGGLMVVQYNTNHGLKTEEIGPYPFKLSRDRVTNENALPTLLVKEHPIFSTPNKLSATDFDNWVQERGLYFANEWDEKYTPLISWNDPNEDKKQGSLLVTEYGKGHFVFTGISFFRQLPSGVEGAYKLFANILSYGRQ